MLRIEYSKKTIKTLERKLKFAKKIDNVGLITKIIALLMLANKVPTKIVSEIWDITERTLYSWQSDFLVYRTKSLLPVKRKGNLCKLTKKQKQELKKIVLNGPELAGFSQGIWTSAMIRDLISKIYKVNYNRRYVCELLKKIGLSYQKGKFISDKFDSDKRILWKNETWPNLLKRAKKENAVLLFEDEVSFALWGSLGYTWGLKGQQPLVKTTGKRKCLKSFGVMDYFSGRFVFQTE